MGPRLATLLLTVLSYTLASCSLPPEVQEWKEKQRAKKEKAKTNTPSIDQQVFSHYEEVFVKLKHKGKKINVDELRVTDRMKKWLLRHVLYTPEGDKLLFLGYLETKMRGFYDQRQFTYVVYPPSFDQPIGFFLENGNTYRYTKTIDGELEVEFLGTFEREESLQKLYGTKGKIQIKPLHTFEKEEQRRAKEERRRRETDLGDFNG